MEAHRTPRFRHWAVAALAWIALPALADASDQPRVSMIEENDAFVSTHDRDYTQGLRISALLRRPVPGGFWDTGFDGIGWLLPMFSRNQTSYQRRVDWQVLGQSQYTPQNLKVSQPDPTDHPYAAWLYTGLDAIQENDGHSLHDIEVTAGVVGPAALGRETQGEVHRWLRVHYPEGWSHQLANRGAFQVSYSVQRRLPIDLFDGYGMDAIPQAGFTAGSVMRDLELGGLLRIGNGLHADYGPERIRPALSGTGFYDPQRLGRAHAHLYFFVGGQARYVEYNRFIDGGREVEPVSLDRRNIVVDLLGGASLYLGHGVRGDFTLTRRSREFTEQTGVDTFGSIRLTAVF